MSKFIAIFLFATLSFSFTAKSACAGYLCRPLSDLNTEKECKNAGKNWKNGKCFECYN